MLKNFLIKRTVNGVEGCVVIKDVSDPAEAVIMSQYLEKEAGNENNDFVILGIYDIGVFNHLETLMEMGGK